MEFAFQDLVDALELDPTDIYVNRLALLFGATSLKVRAAPQLIQNEATDRNSLKLALELLFSEGAHLHFWFRRFGDELTGWVVWIGTEDLEVRGTV